MTRVTGTYRISRVGGEQVRAFVPAPLPPRNPPLELDEESRRLLAEATASLSRLEVSANLIPNAGWFLYGFVRKEALITSQIEGTQATLEDVLAFEAGQAPKRPDDVMEVCNYVRALDFARRELAKPKGLPLARRLLCGAHRLLMSGTRGSDRLPGEIRRSQNWIGGTRPGNAQFVPPPHTEVPDALSSLERWIHAPKALHPLVSAGLAHVQFETIHPFLDGNGRIGRLLIALLAEHWQLIHAPVLYISVAFKRHRGEYYERLSAVRLTGDWEGWIRFFLGCVQESADDGVAAAQRLFALVAADRVRLTNHASATVPAIRLFEQLPSHPIVTLPLATEILQLSKPTVIKAMSSLQKAGILKETTGRKRDRAYAYDRYLRVLTEDTD